MNDSSKWIFSAALLMGLSFHVTSCTNMSELIVYQEKCRVAGGLSLSPKAFAAYSCTTCYKHMDQIVFDNGTKLQWYGSKLRNPATNELYEPNYENTSSPIFQSFRTPQLAQKWIDCCRMAVECCRTMRTTPPSTTDEDMCPRTWDGWNCWRDTPAGLTAQNHCPIYIYFHNEQLSCNRYATKQCLGNGTWYKNKRGTEYSDYVTCGYRGDIQIRLNVHVLTFGVSVIALLPALGIFFYYRQLKVHRIFMHKNLFLSLLIQAIFGIIYESYFMMDTIKNKSSSMTEANLVSCRVFYTFLKYFRLTSYMWMFCEGFYLHRLIVAAFAEQKSMMLFHLVGWGFPVIPVTIWATIRKLYADEKCWSTPMNHFEWILRAPMLAALLMNFCFLIHIIQVLITKLRSSNTDEPTQFRRAVRAAMVLVPLFGLHFLLLSYHPSTDDCTVQKVYNIIFYTMDGLQGGIVSVLFCYLNSEVLFLLKRSYSRQKMMRDIGSHVSRRTRESRTSVSTNVDLSVNDGNIVTSRIIKK